MEHFGARPSAEGFPALVPFHLLGHPGRQHQGPF